LNDKSQRLTKDKAILPISYFGPIEYYWILSHCDSTLEACENYQKRTVRNRTQILAANGPFILSVPLQRGKTLTAIREVRIAYETDWVANHIKTLSSAYRSAPYFDYYSEPIFDILSKEWKLLWDLNMAIMKQMQKWITFETLVLSDTYLEKVADTMIDKRSMKAEWIKTIPAYNQVFEAKYGYHNNLSILDAIFNLGPATSSILSR